MSLTLDELKRRLTAATSAGSLYLGPTTLDSPDLAKLFRDFLPGGVLDLQVRERADTVESVVFTGSLDWPLSGSLADVHATFTIGAAGNAQASLSVAPPGSWRLRDPFPGLDGTPLEAVALKAATAVMRSAGVEPAETGAPAGQAVPMHIEGALDPGAAAEDTPLSFLRALIPAGASIQVSGEITKQDGVVTAAIHGDAFSVRAGGFTTTATLSLIAGPEPDGRTGADVVLALSIGEGDAAVAVSGSLPVDSSKLFLTISPSRSLDSIRDIAGLLPGKLDEILEKVPGPKLFEATGIRLDHVIVVLNLAPPGVGLIAAGIGTPASWDLLGDDRLVIGDVELTLLVSDPFHGARPFAALSGTIMLGSVPFQVEATTDGTVVARLAPGHILHISSLIDAFLPAIPADLPDVTQAEIRVGPGKTYGMDITIGGPWHIPAGPRGLAVGPVFVHIDDADPSGSSKPTGRIEGWADLFGVTLHVSDQLGGPLELGATLPRLPVGDVLAHFAPTFIPIPDPVRTLQLDDAAIDFVKDGERYSVDLSTEVKTATADFGTVELIVQERAGAWEAALGFQLPDDWRLSALSHALTGFDRLQLRGTGLVLSSFAGDPGFRKIHITPAGGGFQPGIVLASTLSLVDGAIGSVPVSYISQKVLPGCVDHATLSATIAADMTRVEVAASIDGEFTLVRRLVTLRGVTLGFGYQTTAIYVRLSGMFDVQAHQRKLHFTVSLTLDELGGYGAATMEGTWHDAFDVNGLDLTNVALVAGIDVEGIPTFGVAGQIDMPGFDGSLALFFDSTSGSTVLAGSFSDITLGAIGAIFLPPGTPAEMPKSVADSGFVGVPVGRLDLSVAALLDAAVDTHDRRHDLTDLTDRVRECLPDLNQPFDVARPAALAARTWYVTDRTQVRTWQIREAGGALAVSTETQLYLAGPTAVKIGELAMPAGFRLAGRLRISDFDFTVVLDGEPAPGGGFFAEANANEALDWQGVLTIARGKYAARDAGTAKGPFLSLATFDARSRGAQIAGPHFIVSGQVELFGAAGADVDFTADDHGFTGHFDGHVGDPHAPAGSIDVDVRFASPLDFGASGHVHVSIAARIPEVRVPDTSLVLVPPFDIPPTGMDAGITLAVAESGFTLTYGGTFSWRGRTVVVPDKTEMVTAADVQHLEKLAERFAAQIVAEAGHVFHFLVADAESWVRSMKQYFAGKVANPEKILRQQFHRTSEQIAGLLHTLGYTALRIYETLAAEFSAVLAVQALASPLGLGMTAVQIAKLLAPVIPDPVALGKLLYKALDLSWTQLYGALKAAFDLSWSELVSILKKIF